MKRCPSCQQTFPDNAPDYCSNDGMRLVDEEAATFDPERTVMASGLRGGGGGGEPATPPSPPQPPPQPSLAPQPYQTPDAMAPGIKPPTEWQPSGESQQQQSPQPWNAPGAQNAPQGAWTPAPPQPAQNWGGPGYQQPAAGAPYSAPYTPLHGGRSSALSIAALVTGACAVTIMSLLVFRDRDFVYTAMLVLAILGLGLGITSLILSLQRPTRFGGVPLAIAGLATGTAALVYYFTL